MFYEQASAPFLETIRLIEDKEPPFVPPYSEDGEPPFLEEWMEATTGVQVVGQTCVSILSECVRLYFLTWERELGVKCARHFAKDFKRGYLRGYRTCFEAITEDNWSDSGADLDVIEEVVLVRNASQHPDSITNMELAHSISSGRSAADLFFIRDSERAALSDPDSEWMHFLGVRIYIDRDKLFSAIDEVEKLTAWLEERFFDAKYPNRRNTSNNGDNA
jgi:hypothetical protein